MKDTLGNFNNYSFSFIKNSTFYSNPKSFLRILYLPFFGILSLFNKNNSEILNLNYYYFQKIKWNFFKNSSVFYILDYFYILIYSVIYKDYKYNNFNLRVSSRLKQTSWSFYNNGFNFNSLNFNIIHYLAGLRYIWVGLQYWILGLILGLTTFYYLMYIRLLPFNKIIFEWVLIIMFLYWLLSGFVFFIKKYQHSKFTSVIQRFWKRSYLIFWSIESGTFLVFFYLTLNAPEEPVYMYDQIKLFKSHLFSWRLFLLKLVPVITLIILSYYLLLSLKWSTFSKQSLWIVVLTLLLIYVFWLEFYQFFHIINYYGNLVWDFDSESFLWNLEPEFKRTRIANNLVTICLLAKFWHLVFIFVFWIFFILRVAEIGRIRYPLMAANAQNFVILYILSWLYMYPWLKFLVRRHMETQYYWYFYNARRLGMRVFINDLKLFFISLLDCNTLTNVHFKTGNYFYWIESSSELGFLQYKKHIIRDYIINQLNVSNSSVINSYYLI